MLTNVTVLVSVGRNPVSGRVRRASNDAQAVEMAIGIAGGVENVEVVYAGGSSSPALREYLGMGVPRLTMLQIPEGFDPAPVLARYLHQTRPTVILTGIRAEAGEASGFLPYWLGNELAIVLLPEVVELRLSDGGWEAILAAPGGRRRRVIVTGPLIVAVGTSAPVARAVAYGHARRGEIRTERVDVADLRIEETREIAPARRRPKRLAATLTTSHSAMGPLVGLSADDAARTIAAFLEEGGFLS